MEYPDAQEACWTQGGYLAELTSKEKNDYVKNLVSKELSGSDATKAYIGLWYEQGIDEPVWYWDESYKNVDFTDWANPNWRVNSKYKYVCGALSKDYDWAWVQEYCFNIQGLSYVCERKPVDMKCFQGSCYQLLRESLSISNSQDECKAIGGYVVEIDSAAETAFVADYLDDEYIPYSRNRGYSTRNVWLGATDASSEGAFYWMSTNKKINFSDWQVSEPNNHGVGDVEENCVVLESEKDFAWNDVSCDGNHAVMCEIPFSALSGITLTG